MTREQRIVALMRAIVTSVEAVADVDVLMKEVDDKLCVAVVDIPAAVYDDVKAVLDVNYCESLVPVKVTEDALFYALPVVREGVA